MAKSNRKKLSQSHEFNLNAVKTESSPKKLLRVGKLDSVEDDVNHRVSNIRSEQSKKTSNIGEALLNQTTTTVDDEVNLRPKVIQEQSSNSEDETSESVDENDYMPLVIVPSKRLESAIEGICLLLARTYREKILSKVPELCLVCGYEEADAFFDQEKLSNEIR